MRFTPTIFSQLVEPLDRRRFEAIVARFNADAYDKSFRSWDHLMVLIHAQLSGASSLRALEASWNAHANAHYHLGCGEIARSTLADANARRPFEAFAEVLTTVAALTNRSTRAEAKKLLRLIDSTPIPLGQLFDWAKSNGRIRGMKAHVVYDPGRDLPQILDITDANVNDAEIGREIEIEPGLTYVFDKGYCHYGWWRAVQAAGAFFVTRPKTNMGMTVTAERQYGPSRGDGFTVISDEEVALSSKGDSKLPIPLRRIEMVRDEDAKTIVVITNDMQRSAVEIAQAYKFRWLIELLFRWLKQHLKLRKFLGLSPNAVKLQIYAAMIAYILLRLAAKAAKPKLEILRFTELVGLFLFARRRLTAIDAPPPTHPSRKRDRANPNQMAFRYA
ncbi:MAG TPA: IS4 family transposase [Roseiarcus sp.]|nr:IS4 family transposase [Roseiarcus sp.]